MSTRGLKESFLNYFNLGKIKQLTSLSETADAFRLPSLRIESVLIVCKGLNTI